MFSFKDFLSEAGNKPKILPPIDHEKIHKQLEDHVRKSLKKSGVSIGEIHHEIHHDGTHSIAVEHNAEAERNSVNSHEYREHGPHVVKDIVQDRKHPNVHVIGSRHHEGNYDWAADHYNKPTTVVKYKIVR